jgi:hypothetical protein
MHTVTWLDTRNDEQCGREFGTWVEAEKFMKGLRRKFPHSPIEYREV